MPAQGRQGPSPEECFRRPGITHARRLLAEYSFELEGIARSIRLRVYEAIGTGELEIDQSHYLQAPGMASPAFAEGQRYRSVAAALEDVLETFTAGYRAAVGAGHAPDPAWLLPDHEL